jgi:hypothetical protein
MVSLGSTSTDCPLIVAVTGFAREKKESIEYRLPLIEDTMLKISGHLLNSSEDAIL